MISCLRPGYCWSTAIRALCKMLSTGAAFTLTKTGMWTHVPKPTCSPSGGCLTPFHPCIHSCMHSPIHSLTHSLIHPPHSLTQPLGFVRTSTNPPKLAGSLLLHVPGLCIRLQQSAELLLRVSADGTTHPVLAQPL